MIASDTEINNEACIYRMREISKYSKKVYVYSGQSIHITHSISGASRLPRVDLDAIGLSNFPKSKLYPIYMMILVFEYSVNVQSLFSISEQYFPFQSSGRGFEWPPVTHMSIGDFVKRMVAHYSKFGTDTLILAKKILQYYLDMSSIPINYILQSGFARNVVDFDRLLALEIPDVGVGNEYAVMVNGLANIKSGSYGISSQLPFRMTIMLLRSGINIINILPACLWLTLNTVLVPTPIDDLNTALGCKMDIMTPLFVTGDLHYASPPSLYVTSMISSTWNPTKMDINRRYNDLPTRIIGVTGTSFSSYPFLSFSPYLIASASEEMSFGAYMREICYTIGLLSGATTIEGAVLADLDARERVLPHSVAIELSSNYKTKHGYFNPNLLNYDIIGKTTSGGGTYVSKIVNDIDGHSIIDADNLPMVKDVYAEAKVEGDNRKLAHWYDDPQLCKSVNDKVTVAICTSVLNMREQGETGSVMSGALLDWGYILSQPISAVYCTVNKDIIKYNVSMKMAAGNTRQPIDVEAIYKGHQESIMRAKLSGIPVLPMYIEAYDPGRLTHKFNRSIFTNVVVYRPSRHVPSNISKEICDKLICGHIIPISQSCSSINMGYICHARGLCEGGFSIGDFTYHYCEDGLYLHEDEVHDVQDTIVQCDRIKCLQIRKGECTLNNSIATFTMQSALNTPQNILKTVGASSNSIWTFVPNTFINILKAMDHEITSVMIKYGNESYEFCKYKQKTGPNTWEDWSIDPIFMWRLGIRTFSCFDFFWLYTSGRGFNSSSIYPLQHYIACKRATLPDVFSISSQFKQNVFNTFNFKRKLGSVNVREAFGYDDRAAYRLRFDFLQSLHPNEQLTYINNPFKFATLNGKEMGVSGHLVALSAILMFECIDMGWYLRSILYHIRSSNNLITNIVVERESSKWHSLPDYGHTIEYIKHNAKIADLPHYMSVNFVSLLREMITSS